MAANRMIEFALRGLQLIFAIIIMGTTGWGMHIPIRRLTVDADFYHRAIHVFRGHTVYEHFVYGNFYDYYAVPDAWGFLVFCAGWTFVDVILVLISETRFANHALIGYICIVIEAVALLSWLAGFIAVAINIGSNACPAEENGCGTLVAATVFGALEWLLFVITTALTTNVALNSTRRPRAFTTSPATPR